MATCDAARPVPEPPKSGPYPHDSSVAYNGRPTPTDYTHLAGTTHPCPAAGCRVKHLRWDILLCMYHWRRVPRALQAEVYRAWNRGHPDPDYLTVRQAAIDAASGKGAVL